LTEEIAGTPGWVDARLDQVFAALPGGDAVTAGKAAYADCLARQKDPVAPADDMGAEFDGCRGRLRAALSSAGVSGQDWATLDQALEALEAEITADS
jgi:hypothetical protein